MPSSYEQRLMAACLATDGVASHRAAAALWSLRSCESGLVEVTVGLRRAPVLDGVIGHTSAHLPAPDVTRRGPIPITTPARTLLDLGAVVPAAVVEPALEDAVHRELVTLERLQRVVERAGKSGRGGTAVLRHLLLARVEGWQPTESPLEDEIIRVMRAGGLPAPVRQHRVVLPGGRVVRIDIAYARAMVAVEGQSLTWHGGRESLQADCERLNLLVQLGWRVLLFTRDDARKRRAQLVESVSRWLSIGSVA